MKIKRNEISLGLESELKEIEKQSSCFSEMVSKSIQCVYKYLTLLREYINDKTLLSSPEDEIFFFREFKPSIHSYFIYYSELYRMETLRPEGSAQQQRKYLQKQLKTFNKFFEDNAEFCAYYRNKNTYYDTVYFQRLNMDCYLGLNCSSIKLDPFYSTAQDHNASTYLAYIRLKDYINRELQKLGTSDLAPSTKGTYHQIKWSASKVSLVELIYALHAHGCINQGACDIKDLAKFFESIFNIELGDIYRAFHEIKYRNNPTKFLETLQLCLSKKVNDQL